MKKTISLLLALALCLSLFACGGGNETSTTASTEPSTVTNSTTAPSAPENDAVKITVAENDGTYWDYNISDGNIYMIDISNYDDLSQNVWSVFITVDDEFDLNEVKYIGCCNEYLDPVDTQIRCELLDTTLTIQSSETEQHPASVHNSLYLLIVSNSITEEKQVRFVPSIDGDTAGMELRTIQKMTGELLFSGKKSDFSEGYCWAELVYADTGKTITAIVNTSGHIVSEFTDEQLVSHGNFYNGVSLLEYESGVRMFVNPESEILFCSDDPDYQDMIKGIYPGGYIFLERTEANLTSNTTYYAIMDCRKDFILDWTAYDEFRLFNYMGGDVFAFLDGFGQGDDNTVKFYNAETKVWTTVNNIDGDSLWDLPDFVAEGTDGWITLQANGKGVLISTKDGKTQTLGNYYFGVIADNKVVALRITNTNVLNMIKIEELGYVSLDNQEHKSINYEYINLAQIPERILSHWHTPGGLLPSYNIGNTGTIMAETDIYDIQFSNNVMLLSLKGVDETDYYALINTEGKNVVEPVKGVALATLGYGKFLVEQDDNRYIINEYGEEVTILSGIDYGSLLSADTYRDGLSWIQASRNINGFIDINGNFIFGKGDTLKAVENIKVSPLIVSTELVEKESVKNITVPTESTVKHCETSITSFEYEYGHVQIKLPDGSYDTIDAVIITKYVGKDDIVVIPAEIDGLPVLGIAESAFAGSRINELYFAGNLATIEAYAFSYCTELTSVVLPNNWMYLGKECFTGCTSLKQLEIPIDCSFGTEEVWDDELGVYQYVSTSPISKDDSTVIVTREE